MEVLTSQRGYKFFKFCVFLSLCGIIPPVNSRVQYKRTIRINPDAEIFHHPTATLKVKQKRNDEGNEQGRLSNQQLGEQLSGIMANQNIQQKNLDRIELKLIQMEANVYKIIQSVHTNVRETLNIIREIGWQRGVLDGKIQAFTEEINGFKHAIATIEIICPNGNEIDQNLLRIREEFKNLQESMQHINNNLMSLNENTTRSLMSMRNTSDCELNEGKVPSNSMLTTTTENPSDTGPPRDCYDILRLGMKKNNIYEIQPSRNHEPFLALCDMQIMGGGWTVFQTRIDGSTDFLRDWLEYENGFGNVTEEFWLGLKKLNLLTSSRQNDLLVILKDVEEEIAWAYYKEFIVGNSDQEYAITSLGQYHGTAGDSLRSQVYKFSTADRDNDMNEAINCAQSGAWWHRDCEAKQQFSSNLNGLFFKWCGTNHNEYPSQGMLWTSWRNLPYSLSSSRMMIRPSDNE